MDPTVYDVLKLSSAGEVMFITPNFVKNEVPSFWNIETYLDLTSKRRSSNIRNLHKTYLGKCKICLKIDFWFLVYSIWIYPFTSKKQKGKIIGIRCSLIFTSRWVSLSGGVVCTRHTQRQHKAKETLNAHILEIKERAICVKKITFWSQKGGPVYATQFTRAVRTPKKLNWNQLEQQIQTRIELFYVWRIRI